MNDWLVTITVDDFQLDAKVLTEYPDPVQMKNQSNQQPVEKGV